MNFRRAILAHEAAARQTDKKFLFALPIRAAAQVRENCLSATLIAGRILAEALVAVEGEKLNAERGQVQG